jgi:hypothetical protein
LGSCDGPWDAQFRGAEEYLGPLLPTCADAVEWPYWGLAQLEDIVTRLSQAAVKFGRDERVLPVATTITRKFVHAGFKG